MSPRKSSRGKSPLQGGFTLIETMVAIIVLTIGLVGVAALMSSTVKTSARSRYVSTAALLASEKLEDLSRIPKNDPAMTAGVYNDVVQISSGNGTINETTTSAGVTTLYTQAPGGNITVTPGGALPAVTSDTLTFARQWTITADVPTVNVRQVTVLVTLTDAAMAPPVSFQMSTVHP
jgi:type IV pilus assembly protein PilV